MPKNIRLEITLFDESTLTWEAPTHDPKIAKQMLKGTGWLEIDGEFYNTDYILKWKVITE